jgi:hypothetical protein
MLSASSVMFTSMPVDCLTPATSSFDQWSLHVRKLIGPGATLGAALVAALGAELGAPDPPPPALGADEPAGVEPGVEEQAATMMPAPAPALSLRKSRRVYRPAMSVLLLELAPDDGCVTR